MSDCVYMMMSAGNSEPSRGGLYMVVVSGYNSGWYSAGYTGGKGIGMSVAVEYAYV